MADIFEIVGRISLDGLNDAERNLNNFVDDFFDFIIEERKEKSEWEFFLHKVYDQSWSDFVKEIEQSENQKPIDLGATIVKSKNMLNNFTPEGEV